MNDSAMCNGSIQYQNSKMLITTISNALHAAFSQTLIGCQFVGAHRQRVEVKRAQYQCSRKLLDHFDKYK